MSGVVGYLTKRFPRLSETFILDEILGLESAGVDLRVYALGHPGEELVQPDVVRVSSPITYLHSAQGSQSHLRSVFATAAAHVQLFARSPRRYLGVVLYVARKRRHISTVRHFLEAGLLARHLKRAGATHLHASFAHGPASVAHFVHLVTGLPFSFAAHAKDLYLSAPDLLARKVAAAEFVLTCSDSAAAHLRQIAGEHADKVILARHGVDTARFTPADKSSDLQTGELRVLAVGRLVDKKGFPVLLAALAIVTQSGRRVRCQIVGAGPRRGELETLIARLGLASTVTILGALTHQQVAAQYQQADVFVQPSVVLPDGDRDGTPNSLLEAMASGLAVVASAVAGIPEVLPDGCGVLVPPGDPNALAASLTLLADDDQFRRRMGIAARDHVASAYDRLQCATVLAALFGVAAPSSTTQLAAAQR